MVVFYRKSRLYGHLRLIVEIFVRNPGYVTTQFGNVTGVVDWRSRSLFQVPGLIYNAIRVFGGTSQTDMTTTNGQILDLGAYYVRNFAASS